MLIDLDRTTALLVLGAMRHVAAAGGALTPADHHALRGCAHIVLRLDALPALDALAVPTPGELAGSLPDAAARTHVLQFLIVMALVDGSIDAARIAAVLHYADALDAHEAAVRQLAEAGRGHLAWLRADVARRNLYSITGQELTQSIDDWILPYRDGHEDRALTERYRALGQLPEGSFGRAFFDFYRSNGFVFPGEASALNEAFASPHDATHVLSGYDTSTQGELLVSTFTAGMHPLEPMAGHILPVILSWHVGIELAETPGRVSGQLDPRRFWVAWQRGSEVRTDVFAKGWSLWQHAAESLVGLRRPTASRRSTRTTPPAAPCRPGTNPAPEHARCLRTHIHRLQVGNALFEFARLGSKAMDIECGKGARAMRGRCLARHRGRRRAHECARRRRRSGGCPARGTDTGLRSTSRSWHRVAAHC